MRPRAFFAAALAAFACGAVSAAAPASIDDPGYATWLSNAHAMSGAYCCTNQDVHPVADQDWRMTDDSYEVNIPNFGWQRVPDAMVVPNNPTGGPIVWYRVFDAGDGAPNLYLYCFAPGEQS